MVVEKQFFKKSGNGAGAYTTIVDDCDADLLEKNWQIRIDRKNRYVYWQRKETYITLHRLVIERMGVTIPKDFVIDHINGDGLDNRRENLRVATKLQNNANRRKPTINKSGYRGVYFNKRAKKYEAAITISLGYFDDPAEAHEAYKKAHVERHGKFSPYYEETQTKEEKENPQ